MKMISSHHRHWDEKLTKKKQKKAWRRAEDSCGCTVTKTETSTSNRDLPIAFLFSDQRQEEEQVFFFFLIELIVPKVNVLVPRGKYNKVLKYLTIRVWLYYIQNHLKDFWVISRWIMLQFFISLSLKYSFWYLISIICLNIFT